MKQTYGYNDVFLIPRNLSKIHSRQDIDLSINLTVGNRDIHLRMPILPAPMDTICSKKMCEAFFQNNMLGMIHRFQPMEDRISQYESLNLARMDAFVAVGLEEEDIVKRFYGLGARLFIMDVANGFNVSVEPTIKRIKDLGDTFIVCGNVASKEGFEYLSALGVDAIRVGIGTGSMCTTPIMTGVGQGIVSSITECRDAKKKIKSQALIIADGGVSNVGDIAKALGLGADLVMTGRMFAGTKEAEGNILKYEDKLYKAYRGSASFAVQKKSVETPYYIEGDETIVEYKGGVQNIFYQIEAGLRSTLSYMAAQNMRGFRENSSFVLYKSELKPEILK